MTDMKLTFLVYYTQTPPYIFKDVMPEYTRLRNNHLRPGFTPELLQMITTLTGVQFIYQLSDHENATQADMLGKVFTLQPVPRRNLTYSYPVYAFERTYAVRKRLIRYHSTMHTDHGTPEAPIFLALFIYGVKMFVRTFLRRTKSYPVKWLTFLSCSAFAAVALTGLTKSAALRSFFYEWEIPIKTIGELETAILEGRAKILSQHNHSSGFVDLRARMKQFHQYDLQGEFIPNRKDLINKLVSSEELYAFPTSYHGLQNYRGNPVYWNLGHFFNPSERKYKSFAIRKRGDFNHILGESMLYLHTNGLVKRLQTKYRIRTEPPLDGKSVAEPVALTMEGARQYVIIFMVVGPALAFLVWACERTAAARKVVRRRSRT